MTENCVNCRFWKAPYQGVRYNVDWGPKGRCLRYPPVKFEGKDWAWPLVASEDWCGEHQEIEK